jgi:hypothetical protein
VLLKQRRKLDSCISAYRELPRKLRVKFLNFGLQLALFLGVRQGKVVLDEQQVTLRLF